MDFAAEAQTIAQTYLNQLPADYASRYSEIADPKTLTRLFTALADGNYITTATKLAGISHDTYARWLKRAEVEPNSTYALFANAVKECEAAAEAAIVADVRKAARKEQFWAAGMTLLERRHPEKWGRRQEEGSTPKVVVQIGVSGQDVKVGIAFAATEAQSVASSLPEAKEDDACKLLTAQAFAPSSSPITAISLTNAEACQPMPSGELGTLAVGSERGPQAGGGCVGGQRTGARSKEAFPGKQRKKRVTGGSALRAAPSTRPASRRGGQSQHEPNESGDGGGTQSQP